jgi:hypothetical protein
MCGLPFGCDLRKENSFSNEECYILSLFEISAVTPRLVFPSLFQVDISHYFLILFYFFLLPRHKVSIHCPLVL